MAEHGARRDDRLGDGWRTYFLTVTGPGSTPGHRRISIGGWRRDRPVCSCAGPVDGSPPDLAAWNATAAACWNRLRTAMRRDYPSLEFFRSAEVQKRGALHHHLLIASRERLDAEHIQDLALRAGFGCSLDLQVFPDPGRAARYLAKYVTKDAEPADVPWLGRDVVDLKTGELRPSTRANFRPWSASRDWGMTMRQVRAAIAASVRASLAARESVVAPTVEPLHAAAITTGADPPGLF